MAKRVKKRRWIIVAGYQKQISANVPANTLIPQNLWAPGSAPLVSLNLTLRLKGIANYIVSQGVSSSSGWGFITWYTPFSNYTAIKDQMGGVGQTLPTVDEPELSPGQYLPLTAINTDPANAYIVGIIVKGELGYYEDYYE